MRSKQAINKEECRRIWQTVFRDSEDFVELYFSRRFSPDNTFVSKADGRVVAQAQCLTYRMTDARCEPTLKIGYVSGLATLPDYRGQGHATAVMRQIHSWLSDNGYDYCLLIPADDDACSWYTHNFSYQPSAIRRKCRLTSAQVSAMTKMAALTPQIVDSIQRDLASTPYTVLHTAADLADQMAVCQMSGGGLYATPRELMMAERITCLDGTESYLVLDTFGNGQRSMFNGQSSMVNGQCLYLPIASKSPLPQIIRMTLMLE